MLLRNKENDYFGEFASPQGEDWASTTASEKATYNLTKSKNSKINELKTYLNNTDKYDIREYATGKINPYKDNRALARKYINDMENPAITKTQVSDINIDFTGE